MLLQQVLHLPAYHVPVNAATLNFYNNTVSNNVINGTGGFTGMNPGSVVNLNMYNNVVSNNQKTGTANSTSIFNWYRSSWQRINNVYDNLIYSNYNQTAAGFSAGTINGITCTSSSITTSQYL